MKNCLVTKLMGTIDIKSPKLGFLFAHVDNTKSDVMLPVFYSLSSTPSTSFPVGTYSLNGALFSNGKTIVEEGDVNVGIPANTAMDIGIPKYTTLLKPNNYPNYGSANSLIAINYDDYEFLEDFTASTNATELHFGNTPDGYKNSGNAMNAIKHFAKINNLIAVGSEIVLDINDDNFAERNVAGMKNFLDCLNVSGNVETFIRKMVQHDKAYWKGLTTDMFIFTENSGCTSDFGKLNPKLTFNNSSTVTLSQSNQDFATYDIDSDTFTAID